MQDHSSPHLTKAMDATDQRVTPLHPLGEKYLETGIAGRPKDEVWSMIWQGDLVKVKRKKNISVKPPLRKNTTIGVFSMNARLRMLCTVATIDWQKTGPCTFCTLTYPDPVALEGVAKKTTHRMQFLRDVEIYSGKHVPTLWRVEWEPRKSGVLKGQLIQHIHLLMMGVPFIPFDLAEGWWRRIIGSKEPVRIQLTRAKGKEKAALYASKYCAKPADVPFLVNVPYLNKLGRHWGITRRREVALHTKKSIGDLDLEQIACLRSCAAAMLHFYQLEYDAGFTFLGEKARRFAEKFAEGTLDVEELVRYAMAVEWGEGPAG
jgi:hypothetical protein